MQQPIPDAFVGPIVVFDWSTDMLRLCSVDWFDWTVDVSYDVICDWLETVVEILDDDNDKDDVVVWLKDDVVCELRLDLFPGTFGVEDGSETLVSAK